MVNTPTLRNVVRMLGAVGIILAIPPMAPATSQSLPTSATALPASAVSAIKRDGDGLFYLVAQINDTEVRFVVDTGASIVVLTPEDARRIGVAAQHRQGDTRIETAAGSVGMRWAKLDRMRIGRREIRNLDAAIMSENLKVSLLGQNALAQLGSITIAGNELHMD